VMNSRIRPAIDWVRKHELQINLTGAGLCLLAIVIGIVLGLGTLTGLSFLLLIFFCIYSVYAYFRQPDNLS
jgi:hypothetical protein